MLYAIRERGPELVTTIPHAREYRLWTSRLDDADIRAINDEFDRLIAKKENPQVVTSSWLPGSDWTSTPFIAIYQVAARNDMISAGLCFGLMLWVFFMERPEAWSFGRYELNAIPIEGITYFRIEI